MKNIKTFEGFVNEFHIFNGLSNKKNQVILDAIEEAELKLLNIDTFQNVDNYTTVPKNGIIFSISTGSDAFSVETSKNGKFLSDEMTKDLVGYLTEKIAELS